MRSEVRRPRRRTELPAPAPMASSPTRNLGLAASLLPSGTGRPRVLTKNNAIDIFVLRIRRVLGQQKFQEFFDVIRRVDSIGERGVLDRLKVQLRGHPNLKRHFNMFLPMQYKLSLTDDVDQQEEEPAGTQADRPIVIDD